MADVYVDSMLGDGEQIQAEARQHWVALIRFALQPILVFGAAILLFAIGTWFTPDGTGLFSDIFRWIDTLLGLATAGLFILAIVWFPIQVVRWLKRRYLVTDRRVLYVEGVLRRNSRDAQLKMITDVGFQQTILGRRMGFGDLVIATASNRPLDFRQMRDAIAFKKVIMAAQMGTLQARADEILGKPAAVPSVAAVATAIDPASFPPPEPAWDGSDVPQIAEDDLPPADPAIFGTVAEPVVDAVVAEPPADVPAEAEIATVPEVAETPVEAVIPVAGSVVPEPALEPPTAPIAAVFVPAPVAIPDPVVSEATIADIDSVIAAPATEAVVGAEAVTEALAKLADLRDSGAITDADFEAKKQELLDRL